MKAERDLEQEQLADRVRNACVQAALNGYDRARWDGLCHEGAWECAIEAMRTLDLRELLRPQSDVQTRP